jgi:hypothetical protein
VPAYLTIAFNFILTYVISVLKSLVHFNSICFTSLAIPDRINRNY